MLASLHGKTRHIMHAKARQSMAQYKLARHLKSGGGCKLREQTFTSKARTSAIKGVEVEGFVTAHNELPILVQHSTPKISPCLIQPHLQSQYSRSIQHIITSLVLLMAERKTGDTGDSQHPVQLFLLAQYCPSTSWDLASS